MLLADLVAATPARMVEMKYSNMYTASNTSTCEIDGQSKYM